MKLVRILMISLLCLVVAGCACRTKRVGDGLPVASDGGPLKDIHFAFDRYDVTPTAREIMNGNVEWLKENRKAKVQVEGHCDERGTAEYNMALGWKRANAAAAYLKAKGVEASRISTISYGFNVPLDPAHNEAAWAKNRRAHFRVSDR